MKLVVDTNILISGSLWSGLSAQLLEAVAEGKVKLVLSPDLLAEFTDVISRPKFRVRLNSRLTTAEVLVRKIAKEVIIISPPKLPMPPELRDPKDLPVLECALAANVQAIVSGDQDLLVLGEFKGIPIINARESLERLRSI